MLDYCYSFQVVKHHVCLLIAHLSRSVYAYIRRCENSMTWLSYLYRRNFSTTTFEMWTVPCLWSLPWAPPLPSRALVRLLGEEERERSHQLGWPHHHGDRVDQLWSLEEVGCWYGSTSLIPRLSPPPTKNKNGGGEACIDSHLISWHNNVTVNVVMQLCSHMIGWLEQLWYYYWNKL